MEAKIHNWLRNHRMVLVKSWLNSLPNDQILDMTKLKGFGDDKLNVSKMMIVLINTVENTVGKGDNAGYQHCLLFPQCFPKPSS